MKHICDIFTTLLKMESVILQLFAILSLIICFTSTLEGGGTIVDLKKCRTYLFYGIRFKTFNNVLINASLAHSVFGFVEWSRTA